jgi:hypothetical protein
MGWGPALLFDREPGGRRKLKRPRHRWENIIRENLREMRKG